MHVAQLKQFSHLYWCLTKKIHLILTCLPHKFLIFFCVFDSKKSCERQMILKADSQEKVKTSGAPTAQPSEGNVSSHSPVTASLRTQPSQKEGIGDEEGTREGKPRSMSEAKELPNNPDVGSCSSELSHVSRGELFPVERPMSRKQLSAGELSHDPDAHGDTSTGNRTVAASSAKARQACQGEGHDPDATYGRTLNYLILLPKSSDEKVSSNSDDATRHSEANQSLKVAQPSNNDICLVKTCAKCRDREFANITFHKKPCGSSRKKKEKGPRKGCRNVQSSWFSAAAHREADWRRQRGSVLMEADAPSGVYRVAEAIEVKTEFPRQKESGRLWRKHKFNFCCITWVNVDRQTDRIYFSPVLSMCRNMYIIVIMTYFWSLCWSSQP